MTVSTVSAKSGPRFGGKRMVAPPFGPRPVVKAMFRSTDEGERERQYRCGHSRAARGDDRSRDIDSCSGERRREFGRTLQRPIGIEQRRIVHVPRARNMARAHLFARLRFLAAEPPRRAGIRYYGASAEPGSNLILAVDHRSPELWREALLSRCTRRASLDRPPLALPFPEAAIQ